MLKNSLLILLGVLLGVALMFAKALQSVAPPATAEAEGLRDSFQILADAFNDAGDFVSNHEWYGSDLEQVEAYRHILRTLSSSIELLAMSDPDFPVFHEVHPLNKGGMDNSDQRYLITLLNGEGEYRLWGTRGSSRRLDFTLYADQTPMSPSIGLINSDQLEIDENGHFELYIGGEPRSRNWIANGAGTTRLLIRQIHADWNAERPGDIHIARVDPERPRYPSLNPTAMKERLRATAESFAADLRRWPELSRTRFKALIPVNTLRPPADTGKEGGLVGRWMVGGHFELADNEALLIEAAPTGAAYQAIQLGNHWWASLDYAHRQSSLTLEQSHLSSDGKLYYVISKSDPGVSNWLDTGGYHRGVILMRYDGLHGEMNESLWPRARKLSVDELRSALPSDEPSISLEQRAAEIARRRAHVQRRFGR